MPAKRNSKGVAALVQLRVFETIGRINASEPCKNHTGHSFIRFKNSFPKQQTPDQLFQLKHAENYFLLRG
jgi:hypothetical protein